jgi:hypothetical protein
MNFELSDEHKQVRDVAREFAFFRLSASYQSVHWSGFTGGH